MPISTRRDAPSIACNDRRYAVVKTNVENLVRTCVLGEVRPHLARAGYQITHDGRPVAVPSVGGVCYNVKVGDRLWDWVADHLEPGVSTRNRDREDNVGYNLYSCVGNRARVVSGDAKGAVGVVTGKHGGIEHVIIDFNDRTLRRLVPGDKILVEAFGLGLALSDWPGVKVMNVDPELLGKMGLRKRRGRLRVRVAALVPARIMGSGLGSESSYRGDYDIQLFDDETVAEFGLDRLRFGDFVAILDADHSYGRIYKKGAVSVGVVVHGRCVKSGHGPGVTTVMTSSDGLIEPVIDANANVGYYLKIGRWRARAGRKPAGGRKKRE